MYKYSLFNVKVLTDQLVSGEVCLHVLQMENFVLQTHIVGREGWMEGKKEERDIYIFLTKHSSCHEDPTL